MCFLSSAGLHRNHCVAGNDGGDDGWLSCRGGAAGPEYGLQCHSWSAQQLEATRRWLLPLPAAAPSCLSLPAARTKSLVLRKAMTIHGGASATLSIHVPAMPARAKVHAQQGVGHTWCMALRIWRPSILHRV